MRRYSSTRTALCAAVLAIAMTVAAAPAGAHTLTVTPALHAIVSGAGTDVTAWVTDGSPNETIQFTVSGYGTLSHTTVETDSTGHALNHFTASSSATGLATITAVDLDDGTLGPATCQIAVIKVILDHNPIWWFGGAHPSNYDWSTPLTAQGPPGNYLWTVTVGTGKVCLWPNLGPTSTDNPTVVESKGQSVPTSRSDVTISLKWNTYLVTTVTMYVKSPKTFEPLLPTDDPYGLGYWSKVWYKCRDQYNEVLPKLIDINEEWTDGVFSDWVGEDWDRPNPSPWPQANPYGFADNIWVDVMGLTPPCRHPYGGNTRVDHWRQRYRVGSLTPPDGKFIKDDWLQRYTDHGRNE